MVDWRLPELVVAAEWLPAEVAAGAVVAR